MKTLDIAQSDQGCHLIEFQVTNFGPYRYTSENKKWVKKENGKELEAIMLMHSIII